MTSHVSCATPTRGLRALPNLQVKHEASLARASAVAFTLVLIAVVVEFCISGNALALLGVNYSRPGGSPFVKFHPATYFAVLAAVAALAGGSSDNRGLGYVFSKAPALLLFIMLMIFCTVYASANVGLMGAGIYIDTYISAGALAVAMVGASDRQRAILARMVLILCVVNVMISLAEYVNQDHFIPLELKDGDGKIVTDLESEEFRPSGFYGHPLIGALATAFGLFLVLSPRFRFITTATCFGIFAVGLLGFGGRTALVVTIGLLALRVIVAFGRDFMRGRVNGRLLGIVLLTFSILGPVTAFLLSATPVGERIAARAYYDDSAQVRADQWLVFSKLTTEQALFGTPATDLESIYYQIGLNGVENPFILVVINLGLIGLPIFACGILAFFIYLRGAYPDSGWLLLAALLIMSGSNSIGTKGPDLFMMTACAITMKGYGGQRVKGTFRRQVQFANLPPRGLKPEVDLKKSAMSVRRPYHGLASTVVLQSNDG